MPRPKRKVDWVSVYSFEYGYDTLKEPIEEALRKVHIMSKVLYNKATGFLEVLVRSVDYDRAFKVVRKTIDELTKER